MPYNRAQEKYIPLDINEPVFAAPCSTCSAKPREQCKTSSGNMCDPHAPRVRAYKTALPHYLLLVETKASVGKSGNAHLGLKPKQRYLARLHENEVSLVLFATEDGASLGLHPSVLVSMGHDARVIRFIGRLTD